MTRRFAGSGFLAGGPIVGMLVPRFPLLAFAVVGATSLGSVAVASPLAFILLVGALTSAFPKAGFLVQGLPLPIMMFLLLLTAILLRPYASGAAKPRPGARLAAAALGWLIYRLATLHFDGGSTADVLALAGWYGLPVLLLVSGPPVSALGGRIGDAWARRMEAGVMLACAFSVVQQVAGIERTVIAGLTRSVGADYSTKPLAFAGGSKIPSTYQNGNIFGVITAVFFLIAADRVVRGQGTRRDTFIMVATSVASVLSGSRTILAGLAVGLVILVVRSQPTKRIITVCACAFISVVAVLQLSPALADRLSGTTIGDQALAQRTVVWSKVLTSTSIAELAVGGPHWGRRNTEPGLAEGAIGAVQQVGVVGMALFIGTFLAATNAKHLRRWRLIFLPVAVSLAADSAYLVFPTIFLPIARMFSPLDQSDTDDQEPDATLRDDVSAGLTAQAM